jgi:hypothetical protein
VGFHCYVSICEIGPIGSLGMKVILAMIVCAVCLICLSTVLKAGRRRSGYAVELSSHMRWPVMYVSSPSASHRVSTCIISITTAGSNCDASSPREVVVHVREYVGRK